MAVAIQNVEESVDDDTLLRRFAAHRDPEGFAELARRHAGLVYATCLRITTDRHDAEELTQECFFQLARNASSVRSSVAGWLHRLATHRALNAVRARGRRRAHEAEAAAARGLESASVDPTWREIEPILDAAVDGLPDELREAIVLHFLQSRPQSEVAARLGVHQSTVSRRVADGLRRLQERLRAAGVVLAAAPLAELLASNATPGGAPELGAAIGKMAAAGAAGGALGGVGVAWAKLKAYTLFGATFAAPIVLQFFVQQWHVFAVTLLMWAWIIWRRPAFIQEIAAAQGNRGFDDPLCMWTRWTWTTPPANWRQGMWGGLIGGSMFLVMAWGFSLNEPFAPGIVANVLVYALLFLSTAARIAIRVYRLRLNSVIVEKEEEKPTPPISRGLLAQSLLWPPVNLLMLVCMTVFFIRNGRLWPMIPAVSVPMAICVVCSVFQCVRNVQRYRAERIAEPTTDPRRATPAESPATASGSTAGGISPLLCFLALVAFFTVMSAVQAVGLAFEPPGVANASGRPELRQVIGMQAPMALFFLTVTIPLFAPARARMRPGSWWALVALAILCAAFDLAFCLYWLFALG